MLVTRNTFLGILCAAVFCIVVSPSRGLAQQPVTREYPSLYKSTRAMGMGGAYIAVGGRADSLFYNPAALINIPRDKGWEVNLLNISVDYSKNVKNFLYDMRDALDATDTNGNGSDSEEQLQAVNDIIAKYQGEYMHVQVADFTSVGKSYDRWAFGVGGIANGKMDLLPHEGFGSDGLLGVNADVIYGGIGGFSLGLTKDLFAGITTKYLSRQSLIHIFTAQELVEHQDNLGDYIKDELRVRGHAIGIDAGLLWKFAQNSRFNPSFGASVMNIGSTGFGQAGSIPQTVNVGFAINPPLSQVRSLTFAVDYVDLLNNYTQDKDMAKRLRYGAELQLFDILPVELALRAGMYEGSPTLGADLRLLVFTVSYTMYTEEVGAYAGQDRNKRQILTLNIGW
jgi:hypothetical protein